MTNEEKAVVLLDCFTKTFCRVPNDYQLYNDLKFRCDECPFQKEDGKCLVKIFKGKYMPDYEDFGSMGGMNLYEKIKEYERKAKESRQIAKYLRGLKQCRDRKDNHEPKTGHWIFYHPLQEDDQGAYICSVCRHGDWGLDPKIDKFCFNCGARMVESEEEYEQRKAGN